MNFLVLIEKYQNAIIGALIVHVLIFVWLNVQNVSFYVIKPKEKIVATLDFTEKLIECLRSRIGQAEWDLSTEVERHQVTQQKLKRAENLDMDIRQ